MKTRQRGPYAKINLRKEAITKLLVLYEYLQDWTKTNVTHIHDELGIPYGQQAILKSKGIIEVRNAAGFGNAREQKWVGMRPSMHMIDAILAEYNKKRNSKIFKEENEETVVASATVYDRKIDDYKHIPLVLTKEEDGMLVCKFHRKFAHILLSETGQELLLH